MGYPGLDSRSCDRAEDCRTLPMWRELDTLINNYLDGVTLADLIRPGEEEAASL